MSLFWTRHASADLYTLIIAWGCTVKHKAPSTFTEFASRQICPRSSGQVYEPVTWSESSSVFDIAPIYVALDCIPTQMNPLHPRSISTRAAPTWSLGQGTRRKKGTNVKKIPELRIEWNTFRETYQRESVKVSTDPLDNRGYNTNELPGSQYAIFKVTWVKWNCFVSESMLHFSTH